jgi:hypothetical protein
MAEFTLMKVTVDIPDLLYSELKRKATEEGRTMKELVLRGVRKALRKRSRQHRRIVSLPLIRSRRPRTLALDNAAIFEIIPFP